MQGIFVDRRDVAKIFVTALEGTAKCCADPTKGVHSCNDDLVHSLMAVPGVDSVGLISATGEVEY